MLDPNNKGTLDGRWKILLGIAEEHFSSAAPGRYCGRQGTGTGISTYHYLSNLQRLVLAKHPSPTKPRIHNSTSNNRGNSDNSSKGTPSNSRQRCNKIPQQLRISRPYGNNKTYSKPLLRLSKLSLHAHSLRLVLVICSEQTRRHHLRRSTRLKHRRR